MSVYHMTCYLFLHTKKHSSYPFYTQKPHSFTIQDHVRWNDMTFCTLFINTGLSVFPVCYLRYDRCSVSVASDEDYERPVIRVHEDTSCLSASGVKRCGAAPMGALDTAAVHLSLHPFPAERTLLPEWQRHKHVGRIRVKRKSYWRLVKVREVQGKERRKEASWMGGRKNKKKKVIKGSKRKADPDTNWNTHVCSREITQLPLDNLMDSDIMCIYLEVDPKTKAPLSRSRPKTIGKVNSCEPSLLVTHTEDCGWAYTICLVLFFWLKTWCAVVY